MTPIEKSKLIDELFSLRKADQEVMESERKRMESDRKRLDDLLDSFQAANVELRALRVQLSELLNQLAAKDAENASLREELKLSRKNLYGKKSQRGCSSKKKDSVSREESKDDFDGTSGSLPCCGEEPSPSVEAGSASGASPEEVCLYRLGMDYRRMGAGKSVLHCSDRSRVPAGARIIKVFSRYAYEQVSELVEHEYQVVRYKMSDGHIYEAKIAIYCYEDGSRSRDALKHILGDSWVRSLQSDGYNVYMHLDDRLMDTEHLCFMAHARAKFKYALEQSDDKDAGYILGCMG